MPCTWTSSGRPNYGSQSLATAVRHGVLYTAIASGHKLLLYRDTTQLVQLIDTEKYIDRLAFDRRTGCLVVASHDTLHLYQERYRPFEETIEWSFSHSTIISGGPIKSLSWGLARELLVGNSTLSLHIPAAQTSGLDSTWRFPLSDNCACALFSPDASLIASFQHADRLVKVWRRLPDRTLPSGARQADFDFLYLPHPRPLTAMKWRQPFREDVRVDNILYTCCMDGFLRIWASDVPHDSHLLTLHETIDLRESGNKIQVPVILDDEVFSWATAKAKERAGSTNKVLADINKGAPELVMLLSSEGYLELHGCYHLGSRTHKASSQRLVYASEKPVLTPSQLEWMMAEVCRLGDNDLLFYGASNRSVSIYGVQLDKLLQAGKLRLVGEYGGHNDAIKQLRRTKTGFASIATEMIFWSVSDVLQMDSLMDQDDQNFTPTSSIHAHVAGLTAIATANEEGTAASVLQIYSSGATLPETSALPEFSINKGDIYKHIRWSSPLDDGGCIALAVCLTRAGTDSLQVYLPDHATMWTLHWESCMRSMTADPVIDICWTSTSGGLAVVAATDRQLFLFEQADLFKLAQEGLREQLPVYHPIMVGQTLFLADLQTACHVISELYERLLSSKPIEPMLGYSKMNNLATGEAQFEKSKADSLCSLFADVSVDIPELTIEDRNDLGIWAQVLARLQEYHTSLDQMGQRFAAIFIHQKLSSPSTPLNSTAMLFAYLSDTQSALVDLIKGDMGGLTWQQAEQSGCLFWIRDTALLVRVGDMIARNEYLSGSTILDHQRTERDPVAASLWMHALHQRKQLISLWRISQHLKESGPTLRLLQNDFSDARWRTSASKNAFALLGKQREVYAAAWFLLAGKPDDARRVLSKLAAQKGEHRPWMLSLGVMRLFEATASEPEPKEALRRCLEGDVMQDGALHGDMFLLVQTHLMLGDNNAAMKVLLGQADLRSKAQPQAVACDAALQYVVYAALRQKSSPGSAGHEESLRKSACKRLDRRGCAILAEMLEKTDFPAVTAKAPVSQSLTSGILEAKQDEEKDDDDDAAKLAAFVASQKGKLSTAPKAVFEEPTMDSFAAFDF